MQELNMTIPFQCSK